MFTSRHCCPFYTFYTAGKPIAPPGPHCARWGSCLPALQSSIQQSPEGITHLLHIVSEEHIFQIRRDRVLGHVEVYLMEIREEQRQSDDHNQNNHMMVNPHNLQTDTNVQMSCSSGRSPSRSWRCWTWWRGRRCFCRWLQSLRDKEEEKHLHEAKLNFETGGRTSKHKAATMTLFRIAKMPLKKRDFQSETVPSN